MMDGGIDDNQGVQSLMLANNRIGRRLKKGQSCETEEIGLLIVSDTDNIQPQYRRDFSSIFLREDR
jgi:hypothetical protein